MLFRHNNTVLTCPHLCSCQMNVVSVLILAAAFLTVLEPAGCLFLLPFCSLSLIAHSRMRMIPVVMDECLFQSKTMLMPLFLQPS